MPARNTDGWQFCGQFCSVIGKMKCIGSILSRLMKSHCGGTIGKDGEENSCVTRSASAITSIRPGIRHQASGQAPGIRHQASGTSHGIRMRCGHSLIGFSDGILDVDISDETDGAPRRVSQIRLAELHTSGSCLGSVRTFGRLFRAPLQGGPEKTPRTPALSGGEMGSRVSPPGGGLPRRGCGGLTCASRK